MRHAYISHHPEKKMLVWGHLFFFLALLIEVSWSQNGAVDVLWRPYFLGSF